jgi:hypothetical protein
LTAIRSHRFHHISSTEFFFVFEAYNSSHISATIPLATARPKPETKTLRPHFLLSIFRTACREKKKEKKKKKGEKKKKKNETSREPNLVQRTRLELQSSNKRKPDLTTLLSGLASLRMKMRALETVQTAQRSAETTTTMTKNVGVFVVSFSALAPTARHRQ